MGVRAARPTLLIDLNRGWAAMGPGSFNRTGQGVIENPRGTFDAVAPSRVFPGRPAHGGRLMGIIQERRDGLGESLRVALRDENTGDAIMHDFADRPMAACDHRLARRLGLEDRHAQGLVHGRPDKNVGPSNQHGKRFALLAA